MSYIQLYIYCLNYIPVKYLNEANPSLFPPVNKLYYMDINHIIHTYAYCINSHVCPKETQRNQLILNELIENRI